MRINNIHLSWFRGSGPSSSLNTNQKNLLVYGTNGSGKSTFVDSLEYVIANGKVKHLSHEYSGRKQEKAIRNTHTPTISKTSVVIDFESNFSINTTIKEDGSFSIDSNPPEFIQSIQKLDVSHIILRQDELSNFICSSKGEKYSVLLPLLGLDHFEYAANNLNSIKESVIYQSELSSLKNEYESNRNKFEEYGLEISNICLKNIVKDKKVFLEPAYSEDDKDIIVIAKDIYNAIQSSIVNIEPEQKINLLFNQIKNEKIEEKLSILDKFEVKAKITLGKIIDSQILILENTKVFLDNQENNEQNLVCPACGSAVEKDYFKCHVNEELENLQTLRDQRNKLIESRKIFINSFNRILDIAKDPVFQSWLNQSSTVMNIIKNFQSIQDQGEENFWIDESFNYMKSNIPTISTTIEKLASQPPHPINQLIKDKEILDLCIQIPYLLNLNIKIKRIEKLINTLVDIENRIKEEIHLQTSRIINELSSEIQNLWAKLHPNELIEEIQLYIPEDSEKAIDISLKYFGTNQPSPRNTLSEGHRNSLGLCVFLALAKQVKDNVTFLVLDDVVSSLDRDHRRKIADILVNEFSDRQILLFTHDREWYSELKWILASQNWEFVHLKPWESPNLGIQLSDPKFTFHDVLSQAKINPELAGNYLRQIMDVNLSIISEKLSIQVEYMRGDKNDKRTCVELLTKIQSEANESLRKKVPEKKEWVLYSEPIKDWRECHNLLIAWANRSSHGGSLVTTEVEKLVEVCQKALDQFKCKICNTPIFYAEQKQNGRMQCQCGDIQWR